MRHITSLKLIRRFQTAPKKTEEEKYCSKNDRDGNRFCLILRSPHRASWFQFCYFLRAPFDFMRRMLLLQLFLCGRITIGSTAIARHTPWWCIIVIEFINDAMTPPPTMSSSCSTKESAYILIIIFWLIVFIEIRLSLALQRLKHTSKMKINKKKIRTEKKPNGNYGPLRALVDMRIHIRYHMHTLYTWAGLVFSGTSHRHDRPLSICVFGRLKCEPMDMNGFGWLVEWVKPYVNCVNRRIYIHIY